jgi:hypothetical protein
MENETKTILLNMPYALYEIFQKSNLRKTSASDTEAIRTAIKQIIDREPKEAPSVASN